MDYTYGYLDTPPEFLRPQDGSPLYFNIRTYAISEDVYCVRYSKLANVVLASLFGVGLAVQLWQGIRSKCWAFLAFMALGTAGEIAGYLGRAMLRGDPFCRLYMLIQLVALSVAPAAFGSCLLIVLKHSMAMVGGRASRSRISPKTYSWVYTVCNIQTVFLQTISTVSASSSNSIIMSNSIMISVLVSQLGMLATLALMARTIYLLLREQTRVKTTVSTESAAIGTIFIPLVIAYTAFIIRSVYRTADMVIGYSHPLIQNEMLFVNLDSCMCLVIVLAMSFYHPGAVLRQRKPLYTELSTVDKGEELPA